MEFLVVVFEESRGVIVDDTPQGDTNVLLELEAGTYTVKLADPKDYAPDEHLVTLENTTAVNPKEITFTKKPPV
jgi:hypothetical protein